MHPTASTAMNPAMMVFFIGCEYVVFCRGLQGVQSATTAEARSVRAARIAQCGQLCPLLNASTTFAKRASAEHSRRILSALRIAAVGFGFTGDFFIGCLGSVVPLPPVASGNESGGAFPLGLRPCSFAFPRAGYRGRGRLVRMGTRSTLGFSWPEFIPADPRQRAKDDQESHEAQVIVAPDHAGRGSNVDWYLGDGVHGFTSFDSADL